MCAGRGAVERTVRCVCVRKGETERGHALLMSLVTKRRDERREAMKASLR